MTIKTIDKSNPLSKDHGKIQIMKEINKSRRELMKSMESFALE